MKTKGLKFIASAIAISMLLAAVAACGGSAQTNATTASAATAAATTTAAQAAATQEAKSEAAAETTTASAAAAAETTKGKATETTTTSAAAATQAEAARDSKYDEYYEIILLSDQDVAESEEYAHLNSFRNRLKEQFNFGYKWVQVAGDLRENLALMLASRTYPDLVAPRYSDMLNSYIEADALYELEDSGLLAQYAPNVVARSSQYFPILKAFSSHEGLWFINNGQPAFTSGVTAPWLEWMVRSDLLKENGWPLLKDENDLYDLIAQGLEKHPETDGFPTVGYAQPLAAWGVNGLQCSTYQYNMGRLNHLFFNRGMLYDNNTKTFIDATSEYSYRDGLAFINKLWRNNMYDREAVTDDWDRFMEKEMAGGRVLASFFYNWNWVAVNNALKELGKDYRYVPIAIMLSSQYAHGEKKIYNAPNPEIWSGHSVTKNAKNVERLLEIYNFMNSEEGLILAGWGTEGVNYVIDEKGLRRASPLHWEMMALPATDQRRIEYGNSWGAGWIFGHYTSMDANGQSYGMGADPYYFMEELDPLVKEYLATYGWETITDMYAKNPNFTYEVTEKIDVKQAAPSWGEEYDRAWETIDTVTHDYTMRLITANTEQEFDAIYEEMQNRRNSYGLPKMLELWNAEYAELKEKYGF